MSTFDKARAPGLVAAFLAKENPVLSRGLGTEESMCTWAAINLALTGVLDASCPPCACPVLYRFTLMAQDTMPKSVRNSMDWRRLIPRLAGSAAPPAVQLNRDRRILAWFWERVLPELLPIMARFGCEKEWNRMLKDRDVYACTEALDALHNRRPLVKELEERTYMKALRAVILTKELLSVWSHRSTTQVAVILDRVWRSVASAHETELFWDRIAIFPLIEELLEMQA